MSAELWPALLTRESAAAYLSVSKRYLDQLISSKQVQTKVFSRRGVRVLKTSLDDWIDRLPSGQAAAEKRERSVVSD